MKRLMCVALLVVGGCTATNNQVQKPETQSKQLNSIDDWVQLLLERKVFDKIDLANNRVWMDSWVWNEGSDATREHGIIYLSRYLESKNRGKLVTILDKNTGRKLGEYAQFGQIQIYK